MKVGYFVKVVRPGMRKLRGRVVAIDETKGILWVKEWVPSEFLPGPRPVRISEAVQVKPPRVLTEREHAEARGWIKRSGK